MSFLPRFSLDNSRLMMVLIFGIIVTGMVLYANYPRREDPSITIRSAIVTAAFPGMSPERVEDLITRPLEEKIREIPEVEDIRSDSKTGVAILHIDVAPEYVDMAPIWQSLRNKMNDVQASLPSGTRGPIVNDEVGLTAIATVALWADGFSLKEMSDVAGDIRQKLYTLEGVKKVEIYGEQEERVYLHVSSAKLAEFGVNPAYIVNTLQQQNIILPGGTVTGSGVDVVVEPSGNFESVDDIADLLFTVPATGQVARLSDIADIERRYVDPPQKPVRFNGRTSLVLSVSIVDGANSVAFGDSLTAMLRNIEQQLPVGYVLEYATFQPDLVEAAVSDAVSNVYQTLVIVLVAVMLFLGWRTGLIVGMIVPLSMLLAIIVMRSYGIELQRVSIAAMIIALGLLVDNGIVVAEDIGRRLQAGQSRRDACIDAGRSLAIPLLTSSLTTILAFMPMMLSVGSAGEFTRSLSQVIIIVLLASWLLAMTVTPFLANRFIQVAAITEADPFAGRAYALYRSILATLLRFRLPFLALMVVALVASGALFNLVPKEFFPVSDRNQFLIYVDLPAGTNPEETARVLNGISNWLSDGTANPDVTGNVAYAGDGGPRFVLALSPMDPDPHLGFIVVNTATMEDVPVVLARARTYIAENYPEARARLKSMWLGPTESGLVEVRLKGPDADVLYNSARQLEAAMKTIPGALNVENDWENKIFKARIVVDQARARRAGVTSQDIANSLASFLNGMEVTDYREGDDVIPVVLRGTEDERRNLSFLASLQVYSALRGVNVPLTQIADIEPESLFGRIKRLNQERTITVRGKSDHLTAAEFASRIEPAVLALDLPPRHDWEWGGELEGSAEAQANLFAPMPYCLAGIVVLLIWQFNSFRRPLIILLTIPLSFIGATVGLAVMKATFGFMAILGLFSLAGIIINNGIVLIDRIDQERAGGRGVNEAIVAAAQARLRPIIMTTITTVAGLIPLIAFGGELWYGMANVVAFGLAVGTVLTLGVVPVFYSLFFEGASVSKV